MLRSKFALLIIALVTLSTAFAKICDIRNYGAVGDGVALENTAIEKAMKDCSSIIFPSGKYLFMPFTLKSGVELNLQSKDSVILAASNLFADWPTTQQLPSYPADKCRYMPFISGDNINSASIKGHGLIDGQGKFFWDAADNHLLSCERPRLIEPTFCTDFSISGIRMENSPFWTFHPYACKGVKVSDVIINNPLTGPNTDGIDPDSCDDVTISRVYIKAGDDAVAIKSGKDQYGRDFATPSKNILIEDSFIGASSGINIGSEMSGDVFNVVVRNTTFHDTEFGVRIKSGRGRGGAVHDISLENLTFHTVGMGLAITMHYSDSADPASPTAPTTPHFYNIAYRGVVGNAITAGGFACLEESPCRNITFQGIDIQSRVKGFECVRVFGTAIGENSPTPCV